MKISKKLGDIGESRAVEYLLENGYSILSRNFHSRFGEIDIIAQKEKIIHFIEVKYSQNSLPIHRITPSKIKKILACLEYYMYKYKIEQEFQVDGLFLSNTDLEFIENITVLG